LPAKSGLGGLSSRSSIGTLYCHLIDLRCLHRTKRRRVNSENRRIEHAPGRMLSRSRTPRKPIHAPERPANRERTNLAHAHCCCVAASASLCAGTAHCPRTTIKQSTRGRAHSAQRQCNTRHDRTAAELRRWARAAETVEYTHTASINRCQKALPHARGRITPAAVPKDMPSRGPLLKTARQPGAEPVVGT